MGIKEDLLRQLGEYRLSLSDLKPVLTGLGALGVASSQRAFYEQRLGEHEWPARYPSMPDPFLNIAGALADFIAGRESPKPSRFDRRPALIDEGNRGGLLGSFTFDVSDDKTVEWGTNKDYAQKHHEGLADFQPYGEDVQGRIAAYLDDVFQRGPAPVPQEDSGSELLRRNKVTADREKQRAEHPDRYAKWLERHSPSGSFDEAVENDVRAFTQRRRAKANQGNQELQAAGRLLPLLRKNVLETQIVKRPMVGVTPELQEEVLETTRIYLERKMNRRGAG
ncbi:MAG TPA: hypothetical protein VI643_03895 [Planctomycetota bacterium]|nr:hypothetical protein [Planctomycetota bacterium]